MKKSFILLFCILIQLVLFAQKEVLVTGMIMEKTTGQGLEFATVVLQNPIDSSIVNGGMGDGAH